MRDTNAVVADEVRAEAPVRSNVADSDVIDSVCASLICKDPETAEERAKYYLTPEFRQRLLEHLHLAKQQALAE